MEIHNRIVTRTLRAPERRPDELRESDVKILDAWLWPTSATDQLAGEPRREAVSVEVSLLPPTRRLLRDFPVPGLERPYLQHLEQRIARNPRDLVSHVRRVYLANALGDVVSITGALTDLFLVLGERGLALRRRLLRLVENQLTPGQMAFFESRLEGGLVANEVIPDMPESRLSKQLLGTTQIVKRADPDTADSDCAVKLARDSIAKGRYDLAQAVLEGALDNDPGNGDVCDELLALYSGRRLRESFSKTYTALLGRRLAMRDRWDELARKFQVRVGGDG